MKKVCSVRNCNKPLKCKGYCSTHYTRLKRHGKVGNAELLVSRNHQDFIYNLKSFLNEDHISWYLLGAFMSDGNIRTRKTNYISIKTGKVSIHISNVFSISSIDRDWLEIIVSFICPGKTIYKRIRGKKRRLSYEVQFNCNEMFDWLISKGCVPKKSLTLKFPKVPNKYLTDFIRGMWDGDGTIGIYKRHEKKSNKKYLTTYRTAYLASGSQSFINEAAKIIKKFGLDNFISKIIPKDNFIDDLKISSDNPNYRLELKNGEMVYKLCKLIYATDCEIYLPRKFKIARIIEADWERPFYCDGCNCLLILKKTQRGGKFKYCQDCKLQKNR